MVCKPLSISNIYLLNDLNFSHKLSWNLSQAHKTTQKIVKNSLFTPQQQMWSFNLKQTLTEKTERKTRKKWEVLLDLTLKFWRMWVLSRQNWYVAGSGGSRGVKCLDECSVEWFCWIFIEETLDFAENWNRREVCWSKNFFLILKFSKIWLW